MMLLRTLVVLLIGLLVPSTIVAQVTFNQIAVSGETTPAGGVYGSFSQPSINGSGDVAFGTTSITGAEAIFGPTSGAGSSLGQIALAATSAPGVTDGAEFNFFFPPSINDSGDVVFEAGLRTGPAFEDGLVTFLNSAAVFGPTSGAGASLGLIARADDPAGVADGAEFSAFSPSSINASGDVAFASILRTGTGPEVGASNNATIFGPTTGAGSSLGLIAREGTPAPGVADGAEYDFLSAPALNASGDVAFRGVLRTGTGAVVGGSNNSAVFGPTSGAGSPLGLIAREGAPAPGAGGAVFDSFSDPRLNASGDLAFPAILRTGTGANVNDNNCDAMFGPTAGAGSPLGLIAREDTPAPGAGGAEFELFGFPSLNALGDIAFTANLRTGTGTAVDASNTTALFTSAAGQLRQVVRAGDLITVTLPGGAGTQDRIVANIDFSNSGLNDAGILAFRLIFTDGSQGIFTTDANSGSVLLADVNLDGVVNFLDIAPFIMRLASGVFLAEADINQDGIINFLDIAPFIQVLTNQG